METYIVRIDGVEYEVEIEKKGSSSESGNAKVAPTVSNAQKPKAAKAETKKAAGKAGSGTPVVCGTSGKVWKIERKAGDAVKSGEAVLILEAMKMEIPVVSPVDGVVSQLTVSEGDSVATGQAVAYVE